MSGPILNRRPANRLRTDEVDDVVRANHYTGDPNGGYKSFVFTDYLSAEQIVELRNQVENEIRGKLHIPFNASSVALRYEHSMGQGLPDFIHRASSAHSTVSAEVRYAVSHR